MKSYLSLCLHPLLTLIENVLLNPREGLAALIAYQLLDKKLMDYQRICSSIVMVVDLFHSPQNPMRFDSCSIITIFVCL